MKTYFIGASKTGTTVARYFTKCGIDVCGFYSRSKNAKNIEYCDICDVVNGELIIISSSDSDIIKMAQILKDYDVAGKTIAHLSGALTSDELTMLKDKGANVLSMHPIGTFAKNSQDMEKIDFVLEGQTASVQQLFDRAGIKYYMINKDDKPLYHSAMVFGANYVVTLIDIAKNIFVKLGLDPKLLETLTLNSVKNAYSMDCVDALTGPIKRGDLDTIKKHIDALDDENIKQLYLELAKKTKTLVKK